MKTFDLFEISGALYLVVQAEHLLDLNSVIVLPVLPREAYPALRKLTVDISIDGAPYRIRTHMPLTIEAQRLRHLRPVHHLTPDEGQKVMDGMNAILWGL
ncbi:CcdB family protein [Roseivivax sp.]